MMHVQQVHRHEYWPSGDSRDLAEVRFSPEELASRYGLRFEEGLDDLDYFKLAAIALADGSQAWFIKYRGDQYPGTLVRVDASADLGQAQELLQRALGLADEDFPWIAPGAAAPEASLA